MALHVSVSASAGPVSVAVSASVVVSAHKRVASQPSQSRDRSSNSWKMLRRAWLAVCLLPSFYFSLLAASILFNFCCFFAFCHAPCLSASQLASLIAKYQVVLRTLRTLAELHTSAWALDSVTGNCISGVFKLLRSTLVSDSVGVLGLGFQFSVFRFRLSVFHFPFAAFQTEVFALSAISSDHL